MRRKRIYNLSAIFLGFIFLISNNLFGQVNLAVKDSSKSRLIAFRNITSGYLMFNFQPPYETGVYHGIQTTNGIDIGRHLFAGLGVGIDVYPDGSPWLYKFIPLFLDLRVNGGIKDVSPYFSITSGYSFCYFFQYFDRFGYENVKPSDLDGFMFSLRGGATFRMFNKVRLLAGTGLMWQNSKFYQGLLFRSMLLELGYYF